MTRDSGLRVTWSAIVDMPPDAIEPLSTVLYSRFHAVYPTRTAAKRVCRRREVFVSGELASSATLVYPGDVIERRERASPGSFSFDAEAALLLPVVYEDDEMAVVSKPAGMATHPTPASEGKKSQASGCTVRSTLLRVLQPTKSEVGPLRRPMHVHRLDKPTSGLLVAAKTLQALRALSDAFAERRIVKRYRAIVVGRPEGSDGLASGLIDTPLDGKNAVTYWEAVGSPVQSLKLGTLTTIDLWPLTGRRHQLRRHCAASLKCAILGDTKYSATIAPSNRGGNCYDSEVERSTDRQKGLFLASVELSLKHPSSGLPLHFEIDEPPKFEALRRREQGRFNRLSAQPE